MTLLIFAAFFAVLGIVCILIPFHIGMTGICLLLLAAVLAALWLLKRKNAPKVWGRILIALTALSMTVIFGAMAAIIVQGRDDVMPEKAPKFVVVLGAQIQGDQPSLTLKKRLDRAYEYLTEHPETLDNGWSGIYINEAGLNDNGTSIYTTQGEQVLAIDAPNKILFVRVKGSGWRGVLAIAKDPSLLCIGTSANISQGTDPFSKGSGQTVGEIVQNVEGGILGITASGFIDVSPNGVLGQGNGGRLAGYCMAQGTEYNVDYHATNSGWHKFSRMELHDDNLMYIKATTDPISENCTDAFEFEPAMIVDGEVLVNEWWSELNPRSCIGQSDKYEILMLVIEGRGASGSWGTDIAHCAEILKNHNCEQAINVDGGASGMMWYNGEYLTRCANGVSSDGRPVPNACVYRAAGYDSDTPSSDTQ